MKQYIFILVLFSGLLASCHKDTVTTPPPSGKYYTKVKTIIQQNCTVSCHSPATGMMQGMPVILDTDSDIVQRASGIKASVADPVTFINKRMPQGNTLSAEDINTITEWYAAGGRTTD